MCKEAPPQRAPMDRTNSPLHRWCWVCFKRHRTYLWSAVAYLLSRRAPPVFVRVWWCERCHKLFQSQQPLHKAAKYYCSSFCAWGSIARLVTLGASSSGVEIHFANHQCSPWHADERLGFYREVFWKHCELQWICIYRTFFCVLFCTVVSSNLLSTEQVIDPVAGFDQTPLVFGTPEHYWLFVLTQWKFLNSYSDS